MSSTQTLSPGGVPQLGRPRFSSPLTALLEVAHEGTHPMNMLVSGGSVPSLPIFALDNKLVGRGLFRGRCPVSRLRWMLICTKLPRFSSHNGNSPDSRLCSMRR